MYEKWQTGGKNYYFNIKFKLKTCEKVLIDSTPPNTNFTQNVKGFK